MSNPPKAPQILKVRDNPPPKTPLMVGDVARFERDGWLLDEDAMPLGRLDAMRDLFMYETRHLKGDWIIEGNIPNGVTIEVTGGNLEVRGNLGKNVTLKNSQGSIQFDYADEGCIVTASRGPVTFIRAGYNSAITGASVKGDEAEQDVSLKSTRGDIVLGQGRESVTLTSAGNILLHTIGANAKITAANRLMYHAIGINSVINVKEKVCTNRAATPKPPASVVREAVNLGKLIPVPLCEGVWRDEASKSYILELGKNANLEASEDFAGLMLTLWQNHAEVKQFEPGKGRRQFLVCPPDQDQTAAATVQQALDAFIEKQRSRETGPKR